MSTLSLPPRRTTPVPFFYLGLEHDGDGSLRAWESMRPGGATDRKIQRLTYRHNGTEYVSEVGYRENDGTGDWVVTAIYEPSMPGAPWEVSIMAQINGRPQWRDPAILVGQSEVKNVVDFL